VSELFRVETDRLLLVWAATRPAQSAAVGIAPSAGRIIVRPRRGAVQFGQQSRSPDRWDAPRLFEQTDYTLFLRSGADAPVSLEHRDPVLLRDLGSSDGGRVVHGRINFGSQIGHSVFTVCVAGDPELDFEVEIFPTKLDYAEDYARLVAETQDILTGLVLEYLRSTFQLGRHLHPPRATHLEWLLLLRHSVDDLERALNQIARHPQWGLTREPQEMHAERIKRADTALRRAVLRGAGSGRSVRVNQELAVRERLQERRARPTLDTPEHRWHAARLTQIRRRLAWLHAEESSGSHGRRNQTLEEIDALEMRIARLARTEPLAAASGDPPPGFASLQLLSAPGYREAYRACLILSLGLHLEGGPVRLGVKDLHLLYEYWCFLTLVRLLAEQTEQPLPARELLATEQNGLRVLLRRGREHSVSFSASGGRRIRLTYNPRFAAEPLLVPQQPDILLEIQDPAQPLVRLVLDAKYRIDASAEYVRRYGSPGPPEDALNGLHRYRDAIIQPSWSLLGLTAPERTITQVIALFPYREAEPDAFRTSRLWNSIATIGIGAIPLLPGSTEYLAEWLRGILTRRAG
jgi:hypothetical protein